MWENSLLRQFPVRWVLWWIVMPNLAALALLPVGGPNVAWPMLLCGILALVIPNTANVWLRRFGLLLVFVLNALFYVGMSFHLGVEKAFGSLPYLVELNPGQSPEYVIAAVVLVAAAVATLRWGASVPSPRGGRQIFLAAAGLAIVINVDAVATAGTRGSYKVAAPSDAPFESAMQHAAIDPARAHGRNVIVIMVESLGLPANREDRALFDSIWNTKAWTPRYEVREGTTAYFGSTTNGELRELCGVWGDYTKVDFGTLNCAPERFRQAGYRTTAMHSFKGDMFEREAWYPLIGFQQRIFSDDLQKMGVTSCPGLFEGVCDTEVPRKIGDILRANPDKPNFVYWLTLNSHLPIPRDPALKTQDCTIGSAELREDYPMLCRGYELHRQLADAITAEIMRPDFPDADILIVGDHLPPYFQRALRSRFDGTRVPWIYLERRSEVPHAGKLAARAPAVSGRGRL